MAYCTVDNVKKEFKQLDITSTTALKTASIEEFIEEADAEIDAIIGVRYTVPVTAGNALVLCRMMSRALVRERVAGVLAIKSGNQKKEQDASQMSREDVIKLAMRIGKGEVAFVGASEIVSGSGVKSYVSSNTVERTFKRGDKQW
jgi:phage gp36-like protein